MHKKGIPPEALLELRRRLEQLPPRSEVRPQLISETAQLYGVSKGTVYRALRSHAKLKGARRADSGQPRVMGVEMFDLAGETVILWWGLFDLELYVEHGERRYGPYLPVGSPIPLDRYRSFKKTRTQQRADRIEALAKQLALPAKSGAVPSETPRGKIIEFPRISFVDPDPFQEFSFTSVIAAKKAIADYLGKPLAKLTSEQMAYVNEVVGKTLNKKEVMAQIKDYFQPSPGRSPC